MAVTKKKLNFCGGKKIIVFSYVVVRRRKCLSDFHFLLFSVFVIFLFGFRFFFFSKFKRRIK
jgi:hypothetical protein